MGFIYPRLKSMSTESSSLILGQSYMHCWEAELSMCLGPLRNPWGGDIRGAVRVTKRRESRKREERMNGKEGETT